VIAIVATKIIEWAPLRQATHVWLDEYDSSEQSTLTHDSM
jgi:hypothetical protein